MTTFNVSTGGRAQVLVDEQQLKQLQAEMTRRGMELERLKASMETLSAINTPAHFMAAAMALCNEMASRWQAERVGLGILKGRYVRLLALSHTEKITRNMQLVQDIEGAMEECLDQDVEIIIPPPKEASFVYRLSENLSAKHGPSAIISLPLRRERVAIKERNDERFGNVVAVLTVERKVEKPFTLQEIEALRLTCDLFTARLIDLYEHDRWAGAKALRATRKGLAWVVGAKHTWAKVAAIAVSGFLAFACLVDGTYRVESPFTFQAMEKQSISAPFDAQLKSVNVKVGDLVFCKATADAFDDLNSINPLARVMPIDRPPTVLATLETDDIKKKRIDAQYEVKSRELQAEKARAVAAVDPTKQVEVRENELAAEAAKNQVELYDWIIDHASLKAPIDGQVFQGDLHSKIGMTVKAGDVLMEIGQESLRAELSVPEDQIMDLRVGQTGILKTSSNPGAPIHFTVERINPIASVVSGKNVFSVRGHVDQALPPELREGIEGLAKVDVRPRRYAWIWTHRMVNWVRMKLWM
jgi:multidrug efflux pump subunit AcrA (membrane-fusion protein)